MIVELPKYCSRKAITEGSEEPITSERLMKEAITFKQLMEEDAEGIFDIYSPNNGRILIRYILLIKNGVGDKTFLFVNSNSIYDGNTTLEPLVCVSQEWSGFKFVRNNSREITLNVKTR
jgi:hypothetical protein